MKTLITLFCAALFLWGCSSQDPNAETQSNTNNTSQPQTMNQNTSKTQSGLEITILQEGTGAEVQNGDLVLVHYVGTFEDGQKFDSSRDRGEPFKLVVGKGQVIQGWDEGILGMKTGEIRKINIPSDLAYGDAGFPGVIPPKTPLVFEIELLEIQ